MSTQVQINWQQLPSGQQILVQAGVYCAIVAMVDVPAAKIQSMAAGYGLSIINSTYVDGRRRHHGGQPGCQLEPEGNIRRRPATSTSEGGDP